MPRKLPILFILAFGMAVATSSVAKTTVQKLSDNRFLVGHRASTYLGHAQPKLVRRLHEEAASLCLMLGYDWYEVGDSLIKGRGWTNAAGTLDVRLYDTKQSEDSIECGPLASDRGKATIRKALKRAKIEVQTENNDRPPESEDTEDGEDGESNDDEDD